jgi:hypothetical protein
MSTTLRDFIARRKGEIRDQLKALKAELKELQVAENALGGQEAAAPAAPSSSAPTIKDMALAVLSNAPDGFNSAEILAAIKEEFSREIERTSLSPQLSRLKDAGTIVLNGDRWFTNAHFADWQQKMIQATFGVGNIESFEPDEEDDDSVPF